MPEGYVRLVGVARHSARNGERVEVEIDLGTTGHVYTALDNEPPDVTLIRIEREQELINQINAITLRADRAEKRVKLFERELLAVTARDSTFIADLADEVGKRLFNSLLRLVLRAHEQE